MRHERVDVQDFERGTNGEVSEHVRFVEVPKIPKPVERLHLHYCR